MENVEQLPGGKLKAHKMPGHWLLARLGKRVLRPGGLAMTERLIADLKLSDSDKVVEFAPGLGLTARLILSKNPKSYTGVERDEKAANWTANQLPKSENIEVIVGAADKTGLADASASMVIGEAMLSMNSPQHKQDIMHEAFRILQKGGHYAIHELLITPDDVPQAVKQEIEDTLSKAIHVGARPLTEAEWRNCFEQAGFEVEIVHHAPMHLLQPWRLIADEGFWRALRFIGNVLSDGDARRRVLMMRKIFHKHKNHLFAISMVAKKP